MTIAELIEELKKWPSHYWLKVDVGPFATGVKPSVVKDSVFVVLSTSDVI